MDCETETDFVTQYVNLKATWPAGFVTWLEGTRGRLRSVPDTMKMCMLKPTRTAAGLGTPPNKWVNNVTESFNNVIKEEINNNCVDVVYFLEKIQSNVFDQQVEELIRGIHGMGEYRLVESMSQYAVDPVRWTAMTPDQRRAHVNKVFQFKRTVDHLNSVPTGYKLSQPWESCRLINVLPLGSIKQLWATAEFYLSNSCITTLMGGNFCVASYDKAFNVRKDDKRLFMCECEKNKSLDGICGHALAVADKEGCLKMYMDSYATFGNNVNKIMQNSAPKRAGEKSHNKKPRKGRNNVLLSPIIECSTSPNVPFDKDLDSEKQAHFSEYWHNNEYFFIHLITNVDCKRAKRCESCLMEFPKHNPKQGSDLLVVHRERYMRPNTNSVGKKLKPILTRQLGRKFYCAKKSCLVQRHPHFWKGLLRMKKSVSRMMSPTHMKMLSERLHFTMESVVED